MAGILDTTLVNQLDNMIQATEAPDAITSNEAFRGAIVEGRGRSLAARDALTGAARVVDDDNAENKAVALDFANAVTRAFEEYTILGGATRNRLLNLREEEQRALGANEMMARQRFVSTSFELTVRQLSSLSRTALTGKLVSNREALEKKPEYVPAEDLAPFAAAVAEVVRQNTAVKAEALDDAAFYGDLVAARAGAAACRVAFRELISSVLRFEASPLSVDEFILKRRTRTAKPEPAPTE